MKKIIAFFLVAVMCLPLVACDNGLTPDESKDTSTSADITNTDTEQTTKVIEITLDNWQEYFEVKSIPRVVTNDFDEPIAFHIKTVFRLKDDWKDLAEEINIAVEYSCTDGHRAMYQYNTQTQELVEGERSSHSAPTDKIKQTFQIPHVPTEYFIKNGYSFSGDGYSPDTFSMEGSIVNGSCEMYSNIEIHRIQGTLTVTE